MTLHGLESPGSLESRAAIAAVELVRVEIPLLRPHVFAGGEQRTRPAVLVRAAAADGREGWGECSALSSPGYSAETIDGAWVALRDVLVPAWLGGGPVAGGTPMAAAALEEAVVDLALRRAGTSLTAALSSGLGPVRSSVEWCAVVPMQDRRRTTAEVRSALDAGAAQIKLKIGPGRDVDVLAPLREEFPRVALAVDANGSYPTAAQVPRRLRELDLSYFEQPLAVGDWDGCARVAHDLGVTVALDESISSARDVEQAARLDAPVAVSVKVARLGGLAEAQRVLARAVQLGFDAFAGGMLETGVGRAIALAVAAQAPCNRPCDAGPTSRYFARDLTSTFEPDANGNLVPPDGEGIGVTPRPGALDEFCVDRVVIER